MTDGPKSRRNTAESRDEQPPVSFVVVVVVVVDGVVACTCLSDGDSEN